jgi:mono/diheme cytochrome c family protein
MNHNNLISMFFVFFLTSCTSTADEIAQKESEAKNAKTTVAKTEGSAVFKKYCVACHGVDGKLALNGAKDITLSKLTTAERTAHISLGKGVMPPFKDVLSAEELQAVVEFTESLTKK